MSRRQADVAPANLALIGGMLNGRRWRHTQSSSCHTSPTASWCVSTEDLVADSGTSGRGEVAARHQPPGYRNPLKKWRDNIQTRQSLGKRIMRNTGKSWAELLFNRTVHHRDRQMVTRLFYHSDRVAATSAMAPGRFSAGEGKQCRCLPYDPNIEISGVPPVSHAEMNGSLCIGCQSSWMRSQVLQQRMRQRRRELRNLVGHFPEIDGLQVVGNAKPITPVLVAPDYKDTCRGLCGNPQCPVRQSLQQQQREMQAGGAEKSPAEVAKRKAQRRTDFKDPEPMPNCCVSFNTCVSFESKRVEIRAEDLLASQQPFLEGGKQPGQGSHNSTRSAAGSDKPGCYMGGMHRKSGGRGGSSKPEAADEEEEDDGQDSSSSSSEEDAPSESSYEVEEPEEPEAQPEEPVEPAEPQPRGQRRESTPYYGATKRSTSGREGNCPECGRSPLNGSRNLLAGGTEKVPQTKAPTKLPVESNVRGSVGNRGRSDQDSRNGSPKVLRNVRNDRAGPESVFRNERDARRKPDSRVTKERDVRSQAEDKSVKERTGRVNLESKSPKDIENRNKTESRQTRERDIPRSTESRPSRERDGPTESRPSRERDNQSPTENRPSRERDYLRLTEKQPHKERDYLRPTEKQPPRERDYLRPTEKKPPRPDDSQGNPSKEKNTKSNPRPTESTPPREQNFLRPTENRPPRQEAVQSNPPRDRNVKSIPETQHRNDRYARSNPMRKSASDQVILEDVADDLDEHYRPHVPQERSNGHTKKDAPLVYNNSEGFTYTSDSNMPPMSEKKQERKRFSVNMGVNKITLGVRGNPKKVDSNPVEPRPESSRLAHEKARTNRPTDREHSQQHQPHQQPQHHSQQQPHEQPQHRPQHQSQQQPQHRSQQQPQSRFLPQKASPPKQHTQVYQQSTSQPANEALYNKASSNQPKSSSQSKPNNQSNFVYHTQPMYQQQPQPNQHHQPSSRQQQWAQQQSEQASAYGQKPPQAVKKEYRRVNMKKSLSDTHTARHRPDVPPPKYVDSEKLLQMAQGALLTRQSSQRSLGGTSQGSGVVGGGESPPHTPPNQQVTKTTNRTPSRTPSRNTSRNTSRTPSRTTSRTGSPELSPELSPEPSQEPSKIQLPDGMHSPSKTGRDVTYEDEPPQTNGIYLSPSELSDFVRAEAAQSGTYVSHHKSKTEYASEVPLSTTNYVMEQTTTTTEEEQNDEIQIEVEGNERINIWINPKSDQVLVESSPVEGATEHKGDSSRFSNVDQMIAQSENQQGYYGDRDQLIEQANIRSTLTDQQQSIIVTDSARNSITGQVRGRKSVVNATDDGLEIEVDGTERISIFIKHREEEEAAAQRAAAEKAAAERASAERASAERASAERAAARAAAAGAEAAAQGEIDEDELPSKRTGGCCCKRNDPENPKCSAQCVEECARKPGICRRRRKNCGTFLFDSCFQKPECQHSCCPTPPPVTCCPPSAPAACCSPSAPAGYCPTPQYCGPNNMPASQPNECCYYPSHRYC